MSELKNARVSIGFYDGETWKRLLKYDLCGEKSIDDEITNMAIAKFEDLLNRRMAHPRITDTTPIRVSRYERRYYTARGDGEITRVAEEIQSKREIRPATTIKEHEEMRLLA